MMIEAGISDNYCMDAWRYLIPPTRMACHFVAFVSGCGIFVDDKSIDAFDKDFGAAPEENPFVTGQLRDIVEPPNGYPT
jgi:hypothetical protein